MLGNKCTDVYFEYVWMNEEFVSLNLVDCLLSLNEEC